MIAPPFLRNTAQMRSGTTAPSGNDWTRVNGNLRARLPSHTCHRTIGRKIEKT